MQRRRFLERAQCPDNHWKFSCDDVREQRHWDAYQRAYEAMLRATSTAGEPWDAVPAEHKWLTRTAVAAIVAHHLGALDPRPAGLSDVCVALQSKAMTRHATSTAAGGER